MFDITPATPGSKALRRPVRRPGLQLAGRARPGASRQAAPKRRLEGIVHFKRRPVKTRAALDQSPKSKVKKATRSQPRPTDVYPGPRAGRGVRKPSSQVGPQQAMASPFAERDIPYDFSLSQVSLPQRRLGRPFSVRWSVGTNQQPVFNMAMLLIACLLIAGMLWQLRGLGQGLQLLGPVREQAQEALGSLAGASAALAETDFAASERQFADAEQLLGAAQADFDEALSSSRVIVSWLDVTGTVRSGEELLTAGSALTQAGQHISRGMASLLERGDTTLTEAVVGAQQDFMAARDRLAVAEKALNNVDSPFLPPEIEERVVELNSSVPRVRAALDVFIDQSDVLLTILGAERQRQYLLLFQNNHELRPTGGFIGSLALVDIDRGAVENIDVQSVYDPDGQLREFIVPPDPLLSITNRWFLRDANWFVSWPFSAEKVAEFFEKEGGPTVDGVVALTPEVIRSLLEVTGPLAVPQYEVTVSAENFWEVTQDQVTYSYDRQLNRPKQFLSDLTPLLLDQLFSEPDRSSLEVLSVMMRMIEQKHLLLYFADDELEERLVRQRWAGELPRDQQGFLAVNNANIGGHKSDQFIEQDIDVRYEVRSDGDVDVTLTIRRTHHGPEEAPDYQYPPEENPAFKDNVVYQRVLVPAGAELGLAEGFSSENDIPLYVDPVPGVELTLDPDLAEWRRGQVQQKNGTTVGTEAGYTSFANWMVTKPGETTVALYQYRLPGHAALPSALDPAERFEMFVYKQPGDDRTKIRLTLELFKDGYIVHAVPRDDVTRVSSRELVWQGDLVRDSLVGAVFEVD